ncbi:hypothetical protein [Streptosporangium sp. NPDC087985]
MIALARDAHPGLRFEVARLVIAPGEDPQRGFPQAHLLARRTA